jgi:L-2-hydroxyglutarate oxidase LhgO
VRDEHIVVVGGGIVGLAVARQLLSTHDGLRLTVVEKEQQVAAHQTGHNSGVVHAGLYYPPGSRKAVLCRRGRPLLRDYCATRGIPYVECGKLIVAREPSELAALREIERRARANGIPGLRWMEGAQLTEVEPAARGVAAVHSPRTAITDYPAIARALADDVRQMGGVVHLGTEVVGLATEPRRARVLTTAGEVTGDRLVICAGLQSDRLARRAGDDRYPIIVPFRGEYYRLAGERGDRINGLIYPVPDPRYPFLGVHFTKRVDGSVDVGPNAVVGLSREDYRRGSVDTRDLWETLTSHGFRRLARRHWRVGLYEVRGSLSKRVFYQRARAYVDDLALEDLKPATAGIRAQAVGRDGSLLDDFCINRTGPVITVRNAPSPAATASLAIAEHLAELIMGPSA